MPDTTADDLLRASPLDPVDARVLLAYALGWTRTQLITRGDAPLEPAAIARYRALEVRRVAGEPVAQLVGMREFFGRPFDVTPDVLIPRPETELLVEAALDAIDGRPHPAVLDLGTGSGAIAVSIAAERPDARVWALDRSSAALDVARRNAHKLLDARRPGGPLHWLQSDWYAALEPTLAFDTIVSNPPYIAQHDPHLAQGDLRFEPRGALTDDADGLSAIRTIVAGAGAYLKPGGTLWIEHGYDQAEAVRALLVSRGFVAVESLADVAAIERTTGGRRPV
ncbi:MULTISPECIES: peptide chain release factor N(5)-glutamine methyltransferase [unclassified Burkholderia]|uniref:peptide chain release factor N(5)-glutamine methyltransferase n=1 Tax=unclassified Burkholderia TaxID=2613784 RepID=UPI000F578A16|nr:MULTISPECIES: peptide chain release factor N(5)-glutamine methyltransferase [unclassified Burkholderia]RQR38927.1 peptide chain release factor N(5)-glutamine methyltransferase [Burkholderia sp. Bp9131]RQR69207.1 peptide chain release factor N(5)-glutamine methyltransferase [Burkholderia sp. Bp9015]RQR93446.1 peptide chain release factor N(5)-glutamine methyltransferase [Burkholderia sp. Bp8994]RQS27123.1 peptide chain release factor N(5)-glutamine methyltransferase [Burkholderia sp. Bp8995]